MIINSETYGIQFKNCIIILDEGHNIASTAEEGYSASISNRSLITAI